MIIQNSDNIERKILMKVKSGSGSLTPAICINNNLDLNTVKQVNSIL